MKVKFIQSIASHEWSYGPGQTAELSAEIAQAWIAAGICVAVEPEKTEAPKPAKKQQ